MTAPIRVDQIRCFAVPRHLRDQGMRCFTNIVIDGRLRVDGLVVRRTVAGEYVVTWPERRDGQRRPHPIVTVIGTEARSAVEAAVLDVARQGGWIDAGPTRPTTTPRSNAASCDCGGPALIKPDRAGGAPM